MQEELLWHNAVCKKALALLLHCQWNRVLRVGYVASLEIVNRPVRNGCDLYSARFLKLISYGPLLSLSCIINYYISGSQYRLKRGTSTRKLHDHRAALWEIPTAQLISTFQKLKKASNSQTRLSRRYELDSVISIEWERTSQLLIQGQVMEIRRKPCICMF